MKGINWMEIRNDRQKGLSYTEIGRKHNIDPRTAKKYALSATKSAYELTKPKPTKLDPFKYQIDLWLEEANYSAKRIFEKLLEQGFTGKATIVQDYVAKKEGHYARESDCTIRNNARLTRTSGLGIFRGLSCI